MWNNHIHKHFSVAHKQRARMMYLIPLQHQLIDTYNAILMAHHLHHTNTALHGARNGNGKGNGKGK